MGGGAALRAHAQPDSTAMQENASSARAFRRLVYVVGTALTLFGAALGALAHAQTRPDTGSHVYRLSGNALADGAVIGPEAEEILIETASRGGAVWGVVSSLLLAMVYLIREVSSAIERRTNAVAAAAASERRHELERMRLAHLLNTQQPQTILPGVVSDDDADAILGHTP